MSAAIFAGSVDFFANWGTKSDKQFIDLAKTVAKQTGINDVSKFLSSQLDIDDERLLEDPKTFKVLKSSFIFGEH